MHNDDHDQGLAADLVLFQRLRPSRRSMLGYLAGASTLPLIGCGTSTLLSDAGATSTSDGGTPDDASTAANDAASSSGHDAGVDAGASSSCSEIPEETAGPYPGDGSNGPNVLAVSGIVRSDIRPSIGGAGGVAEGVALTVTLTLVDQTCTPLAGYAVYLWHCDRAGLYSMYSSGVTNENYLRGVQETDDQGRVTFTTIFPACYSGRWPHIHFEIYESLASATSSANKVATSQLAMPADVCSVVFAESGYEASVRNLAQVSLATDNVFSDDRAAVQLADVSGSVSAGYAATLRVPIRI